ncbi:undecaprenyl-diphosphatase [Desulfurobacterium pacificum]|uniref:Undecaprenyl-diphosphatase n=1 Tax=Desulfurobacterium pacificum TaxID=240166 RepID=A0ABY1N8P4_9BACT|nr:undecaprenyl-diphosphate phosphatase [Desulfurobacterium pacificum]SMP03424.1 undecaprenyl-diphosphatase [Desulfurobacterium pacificum]
MNLFDAVVLGIVEGVTEFLPISSTGHMILVSSLLGIKQNTFEKTFEIVIQLGAILAVLWIYKDRLSKDIALWKKLIVAFIPTGILGLLFHKYFEALFSDKVVATMLIVWGVIFIVVELFYNKLSHSIKDVDKLPYWKAVMVGIFQSLAMVPGTSRSGSTIIGGMLLGMDRKTATEFSFLLAIPTMFAASGFELVKNASSFTLDGIGILAVGFITAFTFAFLSVKWLLSFIKTHSFIPFGIYRIALGILVFLLLSVFNLQ